MRCCARSVLDHADYTAFTRQHELDGTDLDGISALKDVRISEVIKRKSMIWTMCDMRIFFTEAGHTTERQATAGSLKLKTCTN